MLYNAPVSPCNALVMVQETTYIPNHCNAAQRLFARSHAMRHKSDLNRRPLHYPTAPTEQKKEDAQPDALRNSYLAR